METSNMSMKTASKRRGLRYYSNIYFRIIAQDIKSKLSYRSDFIISLIGMILTDAVEILSFWLVFQNFPSVKGWDFYEMLFLYGFTLVASTPAQCMFDNNWNLRTVVYSGDFIKYCFRPVNLFFYFMSEIFDIKGVGKLFVGLSCIVYSWNKLALPVNFKSLVLLIFGFVFASLIVIAILNLASSACFFIMNSFFVLSLSNTLRGYARYPITIFSGALKFVFTFIAPIAFMAYYPSMAVLRPDNVPVLTWFTPVFGIVFFYISYKVWMKGALSYNGTGN